MAKLLVMVGRGLMELFIKRSKEGKIMWSYLYPKECSSINLDHKKTAMKEFEKMYNLCWDLFYERYPNSNEMTLREKNNIIDEIRKEVGLC